MTTPNLILTDSIEGNTVFHVASSSTPTNVLSNGSGSNKIYKLNTITAANPNIVNVPITVEITRSSSAYYLAANVTVPGNSTLVVQAKDTAIYMMEGDTLRCNTAGTDACHFTVSYEVIA
jgi:hypothetical protein